MNQDISKVLLNKLSIFYNIFYLIINSDKNVTFQTIQPFESCEYSQPCTSKALSNMKKIKSTNRKRIFNSNEKYNKLKPIFERFSTRATQEGTENFSKVLDVFELLTNRLEQNDFDEIYARLSDLLDIPPKPVISTSTRDINEVLRQQKTSLTSIKAPFTLVKCSNPVGRPSGQAASAVSFHPNKDKLQNVIKRKAANVLNIAKGLSIKKPKITIETIETIETQTIKTTTVKTKTTSHSSKNKITFGDSSDTSNDASSFREIEKTGAPSIAPSLLKPNSLDTKFFNSIKSATIKDKVRLTSTDIVNFQQLLRFQFPKINGLVLCPASCLDPRPLTNSIFIYLLDYQEPNGRNHWILFTNINLFMIA